jgi:thioredoxin reductase (NADPH)
MVQGKSYDSIILGAGVAGMTSSIYLSRYRISHLIFGEVPGGQALDATVIENYPGFTSISGLDLVKAFKEHTESYGIRIRQEKVGELSREGDVFKVKNEEGDTFKANTLILALGARRRVLNIPGEDDFLGKGVTYCATCDAPLFKGKDVVVVGGGDSAVTAAIHTASFARKVYIIHRRPVYRAVETEVEKMRSIGSVIEVLDNTVEEVKGDKSLEEVVLTKPFEGKKELAVQGMVVEIGLMPASSIAKTLGVEMDKDGYIKIEPTMETTVSGVFAAGDLALISGALPFRQIVTSAADGARAAASVYKYLRKQPPTPDWG